MRQAEGKEADKDNKGHSSRRSVRGPLVTPAPGYPCPGAVTHYHPLLSAFWSSPVQLLSQTSRASQKLELLHHLLENKRKVSNC